MVEENHTQVGLGEACSYPLPDLMQILEDPEVNCEGDTLALAEETTALAFLQKLSRSLPADRHS